MIGDITETRDTVLVETTITHAQIGAQYSRRIRGEIVYVGTLFSKRPAGTEGRWHVQFGEGGEIILDRYEHGSTRYLLHAGHPVKPESHACSPEWVVAESIRRYPLDLVARVSWLHEMAYASTNEADRHEILRRIRRLRGA
jgi:hypothetical protein